MAGDADRAGDGETVFMIRFQARRDLLRVLPLALISTLMPRVGISAAETQADKRVRNEGSKDVPAELKPIARFH